MKLPITDILQKVQSFNNNYNAQFDFFAGVLLDEVQTLSAQEAILNFFNDVGIIYRQYVRDIKNIQVSTDLPVDVNDQ